MSLPGNDRTREAIYPLHAFRYLPIPIPRLQLSTVLKMIEEGTPATTQCNPAEVLPELAPYVDGRIDPLPGVEYRLSDGRQIALMGRYGTQLQVGIDGKASALSLGQWMELCHDALLVNGPFDSHVALLRAAHRECCLDGIDPS